MYSLSPPRPIGSERPGAQRVDNPQPLQILTPLLQDILLSHFLESVVEPQTHPLLWVPSRGPYMTQLGQGPHHCILFSWATSFLTSLVDFFQTPIIPLDDQFPGQLPASLLLKESSLIVPLSVCLVAAPLLRSAALLSPRLLLPSNELQLRR